jgi:phage terminase Nu1 subunit (DNA packaging protein)
MTALQATPTVATSTRPAERLWRVRLLLWWWTARDRLVAAGRDRGDVPGWVLVTLMTAGLVLALWALAGPALSKVFTDSIARVTGEIGG